MPTLFNKSSHDNKCIFIHIPKVAGISIESALFENKFGHNTAIDYLKENEDLFNEFYKFSFVRDPYSRLASAFFYLKKGGRNDFDRKWAERFLADFEDFRDFVMALRDMEFRKKIFNGIHFRKQYRFVCDNDGKIIVDFVGRFENLDTGFRQVCRELGKDVLLKKKNLTNNSINYMDIYDYEMKKTISSIYRDDFEIFGYESKV